MCSVAGSLRFEYEFWFNIDGGVVFKAKNRRDSAWVRCEADFDFCAHGWVYNRDDPQYTLTAAAIANPMNSSFRQSKFVAMDDVEQAIVHHCEHCGYKMGGIRFAYYKETNKGTWKKAKLPYPTTNPRFP